ncbi:MAG: RNA-binding protein [Myxococcales bacterium]|nr:RNA-binding protein [Myxococcales bacterium]
MAERESTQLEDLVRYLVEPLVNDPESITVTEIAEEKKATTVMRLEVAQDDIGRVIGRQGRVIRSLRTLMTVASQSLDQPVTLDLVD